MQHKNCSHENFLQRTDALASALNCFLKDLPAKLQISERALYGYRAAKFPVTAKALRKLEAAERAAGITPDRVQKAEPSTDPKHPGIGESANVLRDDVPSYRTRAGEKPPAALSLEERVTRLENLLNAVADAWRSMGP